MNEISRIDSALDEDEIHAGAMLMPMVERAEIDMQIATARRYPRSLKEVSSRIYNLVTLDEESAEECTYALPRGGKPIKGPSIRFAESLQQAYGNNRAAARVVEINRVDKYVEAEGVFLDLETNVATTVRTRRRIVDKHGKLYSDDMILVTGNAAGSIAKRNAILGGVPKPLWRAAYEAANRVISGDVTTLAVNREKALKAFAAFGVKPEQLFTALDIKGVEDVTVDHIGTLRGMHSALKNGESTVEEMFAPPTAERKIDAERNPLVDSKERPKPADQTTKSEPEGEPDPEMERAGASAAIAEEPRKAPEDLTPAQMVDWLRGYDAVAGGQK